MTSGGKMGWGIGIMSGGAFLLVIGVLLSASLVGACLGIPLVIVGLPLSIWGTVWTYQARNQKQAEAIAEGIRNGLASTRQTLPGEPLLATSDARQPFKSADDRAETPTDGFSEEGR